MLCSQFQECFPIPCTNEIFHVYVYTIQCSGFEASRTTVRYLFCLFSDILDSPSNCKLVSFFVKSTSKPLKGFFQDRKFWIVIFYEFNVVFTVSPFAWYRGISLQNQSISILKITSFKVKLETSAL